MATSVAGLLPSRLFFVTDRMTGLRFLVNTGAEVSAVPLSSTEHKHQQDSLSLLAVNSTPIVTYGTAHLASTSNFVETFVGFHHITDVKNAILIADFLRNFSLLVDLGHNRLMDAQTNLRVQGIASGASSPSPSLLPRNPKNDFEATLSDFPTLLQPCNREQICKHIIFRPLVLLIMCIPDDWPLIDCHHTS